MQALLTDALWERLKPLLPPPPSRRFRFPGRKPLDYRKVLNGILTVLRSGIAWDDLPTSLGCGCGKTCRHYLQLWHQAGIWRQVHDTVTAELDGADQIDWERGLSDACLAKCQAGGEESARLPAEGSHAGSETYVLTAAEAVPLSTTVMVANVNEVSEVGQSLTEIAPIAGGVPAPGLYFDLLVLPGSSASTSPNPLRRAEQPVSVRTGAGYLGAPVPASCART